MDFIKRIFNSVDCVKNQDYLSNQISFDFQYLGKSTPHMYLFFFTLSNLTISLTQELCHFTCKL